MNFELKESLPYLTSVRYSSPWGRLGGVIPFGEGAGVRLLLSLGGGWEGFPDEGVCPYFEVPALYTNSSFTSLLLYLFTFTKGSFTC